MASEGLGIEHLRRGQHQAAAAVVDGRDTLVVMPTGSGKSAVYQIAAALLPGWTLVVSPLIALQHDQVDSLDDAHVGRAEALNSLVGEADRRRLLDDLASGEIEFVFVAPEQLANDETRAALAANPPSLFVVDEAHCISHWGHDFRPDYLRLGQMAEDLGRPPVLGLTATASPVVREEIVARLGLRDPEVIVHGFDRSNLCLEVRQCRQEGDKRRALLDHVRDHAGAGIVYVATRKETEALAEVLGTETDRRIVAYHGGLAARARRQNQSAFMDGKADVIVATNAFGMGIDKADVRYVIHHHVPESLDAYYQEAGRAGRDGAPALALLLWRPEDLGLRRFFAGGSRVDADELERVVTVATAAGGPVDVEDLSDEARLAPGRLARHLAHLEESGAVEVSAGGDVTVVAESAGDAARQVVEHQELRHEVGQSRLEMMRAYAEARTCRRRVILTYFGESAPGHCGNCDVCLRRDNDGEHATEGERQDVVTADGSWPEQSRVRHGEWGEGLVLRRDGDAIVVLFDEAGYRTLSAELVASGDLLLPVSP